jgi:hypothetical protein
MLKDAMPAPTDWETLARARGFEVPPEQLDRVLEPLRALERRFRPLAAGLSFDLEPATAFRADPEYRD